MYMTYVYSHFNTITNLLNLAKPIWAFLIGYLNSNVLHEVSYIKYVQTK